ncbi:putative quinol monooxygenase [Phycicoccus duodecadis]|uniref:Quinol monooxygenase YgiN n=1 Tax=Phycicoccus duodecadis TaxID=173053 RepID=A0A2N3YIX5_9MICO|nr:putative quinol monooxygenase [Phycicoccus duodecadis]PKW26801.1 quinol monooxygenase YgiN [Phycicoccus duodecadis]
MSLHVVATLPAKPEATDAIRAALRTLVEATRQEEGCLSYDLYESASAPGMFVTVEEWTDQAALDAHMRTPHIAAALEAAEGALAGDIAIHPLVPVSAG